VIFDNVVNYYETSYPRALIQFNANFDSFDNRLKSDNLISLLIWKSSCRRALKELTDPALEAIASELTSMICKRNFSHIDHYELTLSKRQFVHYYSHSMVLKEIIFLPNVEFYYLPKAGLFACHNDLDKYLSVNDPWLSYSVDFLTVLIIITLIFCLLSLLNSKIFVFDIKTALNNAYIDEEIYIVIDSTIPEVFFNLYPKLKSIIRIHVSLVYLVITFYGLNQSANLWYSYNIRKKLDKMFSNIIYHPIDQSLFFRIFPDVSIIHLLLFINIYIAVSTFSIFQLVSYDVFNDYFHLSYNNEFSIQWDLKYGYLNYISDILEFYNITKFANSPSNWDLLSFPKGVKANFIDSNFFESQLMKITYYLLIRTRPDFRFLVCFLASKSAAPTIHVQESFLNNFNQFFFNNSKEFCLIYLSTISIDATSAILTDGRSHTGVVNLLGNMNNTACLTILKIILFQDNFSAIQLALKGEENIRKSKYIFERISHFTEDIKQGLFEITFVPTKDMVADILTKPLLGANLNIFG
jgi:hypothetical protein